MVDIQAKGFARSERSDSSLRARTLIHDELSFLLDTAGARVELVDLARAIDPLDSDATENLALLADAAWVGAADERAQAELGAALRIELLTRAASLATLLRIYAELDGREQVGADRALNLAEELARGEFGGRDPDAPLPVGPRASSSRESTGWRVHVQALTSWLRR